MFKLFCSIILYIYIYMNQQNYYKKYLKYKNKYINLKAKYNFDKKQGKWIDNTTKRSLDDIQSELLNFSIKSKVISAIKTGDVVETSSPNYKSFDIDELIKRFDGYKSKYNFYQEMNEVNEEEEMNEVSEGEEMNEESDEEIDKDETQLRPYRIKMAAMNNEDEVRDDEVISEEEKQNFYRIIQKNINDSYDNLIELQSHIKKYNKYHTNQVVPVILNTSNSLLFYRIQDHSIFKDITNKFISEKLKFKHSHLTSNYNIMSFLDKFEYEQIIFMFHKELRYYPPLIDRLFKDFDNLVIEEDHDKMLKSKTRILLDVLFDIKFDFVPIEYIEVNSWEVLSPIIEINEQPDYYGISSYYLYYSEYIEYKDELFTKYLIIKNLTKILEKINKITFSGSEDINTKMQIIKDLLNNINSKDFFNEIKNFKILSINDYFNSYIDINSAIKSDEYDLSKEWNLSDKLIEINDEINDKIKFLPSHGEEDPADGGK